MNVLRIETEVMFGRLFTLQKKKRIQRLEVERVMTSDHTPTFMLSSSLVFSVVKCLPTLNNFMCECCLVRETKLEYLYINCP